MGKYRDLVGILLLVIIGMFIPFFGAIVINYGFDFSNMGDWLKLGSTFFYMLLIFGIELLVVFLYFNITSKIASKKIKEYKQ
jgi:hypothetical protein